MNSSTSTSDASTPPKPRAFGKRLLIGCALVAYTAFLAEVYFRIVDPQPLMPRYVTGTSYGVRGNIPHARYWNHTEEVDVEYRINGQGLRADQDYPLQKPPGVCRVAVFGDSFFFGIELDAAQTFEGQLEKRLRSAGYRADVLNFAVGGFGTAEMLQTFAGYGREFQPDAVIFSWDNSDIQDNVRSGLYTLENGTLRRAHSEYLPGVKTSNWLLQYALYRLIADHSEFYSFVRERSELMVKRQLWRANKPNSDAALTATPATAGGEAASDTSDADQKHAATELSSALLLQARDVVAQTGAEFYLVEIPFKLSRTKFRPSVDTLPDHVRAKLNVVETSAALNAAARPDLKLYYETGQGHLTPLGMSVLVDQTLKQLVAAPQMRSCQTAR